MLIKNAKLRNNDNLVDILIKDGVITKIDSNIEVNNDEIIDAKGFLVIPPFIEPHIHLDTTLTAGEPKWNESGTLFEGIERWSERKEFLTIEDVKTRARKAITWQVANGIQFIRTHVDTTDPSLIAIKAMVELREELKDYVRDHMAKHKTPRYVAFVSEFPMNAAGKILKYKMREMAVERLKLREASEIVTA